MTPELEAEIRDFFDWFCGRTDPKDPRITLMEDREGLTYREVAEQINEKLKADENKEKKKTKDAEISESKMLGSLL